MILAAILLAVMLLLVAWQLRGGRQFAGRFADLIGRTSRRRAIYGWAAGTAILYGWTSLMALALLGLAGSIVAIPPEFDIAAYAWGIPLLDPDAVGHFGLLLLLGASLGVVALLLMRRYGRRPPGGAYRSPAAIRERGDWAPAATLALAAGIGEELFFRLTLPLLVAIVTGSAAAGFLLSLVLFAALHRYQGWPGIVATGIAGALLTLIYLATGFLWVAMLIHVAIDLNALILRPLLFPLKPDQAAG